MNEDEGNSTEDKKPPTWEQRPFAINGKMKQVINLGIGATKAEIATLRKKLERLQYGS